MSGTPLFSILHASARPSKWRGVYDDWMSLCEFPERVEYVLCIDERWGFSTDPEAYRTPLNNVHVILNTMRRCYVDAVNNAAAASTGQVLIVNADDQFACDECDGWDRLLASAVGCDAQFGNFLDFHEFVIEVSTGTPNEHERGIMVMPILSRARYEQQGYVFYPGYESMFADNDFCMAARKEGVVIDARELMFPHRHAMFDGKGGWKSEDWNKTLDAAYLAQNSKQAAELGERVFKGRRAMGFPAKQTPRRMIALCLSGERFEGPWVDALLDLWAHLIDLGFDIMRLRPTSKTNVFVMREEMRREILNAPIRPDMCLWFDDDNPVTAATFDKLLAGLDAHPEVDGVSGWCWIHRPNKTGFMVSCGEWAPNFLSFIPFPGSFANERGLRPFDTGGFPCILMRPSALEKAGEGAFLPVIDSGLEYGMTGEDLAFFRRAGKGGAKFLVDPMARVPHLKYCEVEPTFPDEGKVSPRVACMIRARNEGRWIGRTIRSVKELCGADIFVMEDGSTDDTVEVARAAGAIVIESPFIGQGLDERRDKNWLLAYVQQQCDPDWIIMPDGDEELERGGCEKIRRELARNLDVDGFSLGVLNLWNDVSTRRVDGAYGNMARQSLFRAKGSNLSFKSYYEGEGENHNHVGLHTSNAPGLGGAKLAFLNVFLLHYGYLHREDRIRKFKWIRNLDPNNENEGFYLHTVQGDLPEAPADEKLKHGGPLTLSELPPRLVPQFDGDVPGPLAVMEDRPAEILVGNVNASVSRAIRKQRKALDNLTQQGCY